MGLLVLVIYLPALLFVSIVSLRLAAIQLRNSAVSDSTVVEKSFFYALGLGVSIAATSSIAWWYSELTSFEWGNFFRWVGISLIGPLIAGLLLSALCARKKKSHQIGLLIAGVFHATLAMPFAGLAISFFYNDVAYKPAFDRLCANVQPVFLEKVAPARSFTLLSWWLDGSKGGARGLLLTHGTPLMYVDVKAAGDGKSTRYMALPQDKRQLSEGVLGWRGVLNDVEIEHSSAEYEIEAINQQLPSSLPGVTAINGYRIEIRRTTDKKVIAYSDTYSRRGEDWECPTGVSDGSFSATFIAAALNLPRH